MYYCYIPMLPQLSFKAKLRLRSNVVSPASRHFVTVPKKVGNDIRKLQENQPRKWRWSIKVKVQVWFCSRNTSIFPDKKSWCYLLPIKASVRKDLDIQYWSAILIYLMIM